MITIERARGCAWRALYVFTGRGWSRRQLAHIGIDPTRSGGPVLFFGAGYRNGRLRLPYVSWPFYMRWQRVPGMRLLYRLSSTFWHRMDGRYVRRSA